MTNRRHWNVETGSHNYCVKAKRVGRLIITRNRVESGFRNWIKRNAEIRTAVWIRSGALKW